MKNNKKIGFTLIELLIGMLIGSILILMFGNFLLNYYKNSIDLKDDYKEFSDISLGLKSLQKIIFENAKYITFNKEIFDGGQCYGAITNSYGLGDLCNSKFGFIIKNKGGYEEEYKVELVDCNIGTKHGKQLIYRNSVDIIPLLNSCILSDKAYPVKHKIEFINEDIKEKIFRYYLYTENGIYKQTIFIH